jgi:ribosomal protein L7Ae-like RNA K-turn-binding protein
MEIVTTKDVAIDQIKRSISEAEGDSNVSIVVVFANSETNTVKVLGLNIDEMEVPLLLTETASEIGQRVLNQLENRTIN